MVREGITIRTWSSKQPVEKRGLEQRNTFSVICRERLCKAFCVFWFSCVLANCPWRGSTYHMGNLKLCFQTESHLHSKSLAPDLHTVLQSCKVWGVPGTNRPSLNIPPSSRGGGKLYGLLLPWASLVLRWSPFVLPPPSDGGHIRPPSLML